MKATIMVTSHTYVRAAQSALSCLTHAFPTLCAFSRCAPLRGCSGGRRQQPEPDSFDGHVFFASG
jgi:hypothetical protein